MILADAAAAVSDSAGSGTMSPTISTSSSDTAAPPFGASGFDGAQPLNAKAKAVNSAKLKSNFEKGVIGESSPAFARRIGRLHGRLLFGGQKVFVI